MPVINTLIFDLGGVLYDIDVNRTTDAFRSLNISNLEQMHQSLVTENVYNNLETGSISPSEFRDAVRKYSMTQLTDDQIDDAWNALLVGFPEQRVSLLLRLKQNYQIMLLSNTNQIHFENYTSRFQQQYVLNFESLFHRPFYSYRMGFRKPDPEIFRLLISQTGIEPGSAVFIDDLAENIEAARNTGLKAIHLSETSDVCALFDDDRLKEELIQSQM